METLVNIDITLNRCIMVKFISCQLGKCQIFGFLCVYSVIYKQIHSFFHEDILITEKIVCFDSITVYTSLKNQTVKTGRVITEQLKILQWEASEMRKVLASYPHITTFSLLLQRRKVVCFVLTF